MDCMHYDIVDARTLRVLSGRGDDGGETMDLEASG
jgi:hypothetical protein